MSGLVIVCPFYYVNDPERAEITRRIFHHYRNVADELDATFIGVGSEGNVSFQLFTRSHPPSNYYEYDQTLWTSLPTAAGCPGLSHKFDVALRYGRERGADRVLLVGSDDWLSLDLCRNINDAAATVTVPANVDAGGSGAYVWQHDRMVWWDGKFTNPRWQNIVALGGTFSFTADALDATGWAPYELGSHEGNIEEALNGLGHQVAPVQGDYWMVKAANVLNSLDLMARCGFRLEPVSEEAIARFLPYWETL